MNVTRILIDCAGITASTSITGIPRVFYKYLEHGYDYGRRNGVTILPVYVVREGVFDARYNLPDWTLDAPTFERAADHAPASTEVLRAQRAALERLRRRHELLGRVLNPIAHALSRRFRAIGADRLIERMRAAYHWRRLQRSIAKLSPVHVRPGDVIFLSAWWHDEFPKSFWDARARGAAIVPLLHDVLPLTLPDAYDAVWREKFRQNVLEVASGCDHLMYVSNATRGQLVGIIGAEREPPHSVRHHGFDFDLEHASAGSANPPLQRFLRSERFKVLMVGTIEPKKMHATVLSACRLLWSRGLPFDLLIIGRPGWKSEAGVAAIRAALADPSHGQNVLWLDNASDHDLRLAYAGSSLVLVPSSAEGFGLPVIEALSQGTPVLASDIAVFQEIGGSYVEFFDPTDDHSLSQKLDQIISDQAEYTEMRRRAASFSWPDWSTLAEKLFDDLRRISPRSDLRR